MKILKVFWELMMDVKPSVVLDLSSQPRLGNHGEPQEFGIRIKNCSAEGILNLNLKVQQGKLSFEPISRYLASKGLPKEHLNKNTLQPQESYEIDYQISNIQRFTGVQVEIESASPIEILVTFLYGGIEWSYVWHIDMSSESKIAQKFIPKFIKGVALNAPGALLHKVMKPVNLLYLAILIIVLGAGWKITKIKLPFVDLEPPDKVTSSTTPVALPVTSTISQNNVSGANVNIAQLNGNVNVGGQKTQEMPLEQLKLKLQVEKIRNKSGGPNNPEWDLLLLDIVNVGTVRVYLDKLKMYCDGKPMGAHSLIQVETKKTGENTSTYREYNPAIEPGDKWNQMRVYVDNPADRTKLISWNKCAGLVKVQVITTRENSFSASIQRKGAESWLYP